MGLLIRKLIAAGATSILFGVCLQPLFNEDAPIWALVMYSLLINVLIAVPCSMGIEFLTNRMIRKLNGVYVTLYLLLHIIFAMGPFWYLYAQSPPGVVTVFIVAIIFTVIVFCSTDLVMKKKEWPY